MDIANGTVVGPYQIVEPIGAGGMGEVYRAKDTRLQRHVAIKILPKRLASNSDLRARFEREARAISGLTHPNICSLYDVGSHDGVDYLVMELLDGESLADRIERGALPVDQVLRYGTEIAAALDRAHREGMVHRDLKPANIMITKSGAKLLDFGLAKLVDPDTEPGDSFFSGKTEEKPLTAEGMILGTFQYMAPEQIEGREADERSDIFAFGAILYEMLTGRRAFDGKSRASIVAAVMGQEPPPISSINPLVPPALDRVIRTSLAKDPDDRWQTAHDVMLQLRWIAEGGSQVGAPAVVASRRKEREQAAWAIAILLGIVALVTSILLVRAIRKPQPVMRTMLPGATAQYDTAGLRVLAPDGTFMVFAATDRDGVRKLWKQALSDQRATPIDGTERAIPLAISPGGHAVLMDKDRTLFRVDLAGGPPVSLAKLPENWGASWLDDQTVIYSSEDAIHRVSASGGTPEQLIAGNASEEVIAWPEPLRDGKHILYTRIRMKKGPKPTLHAFNVEAKTDREIGQTESRTRAARGYLVSVRDGALIARPFDENDLRFTGEPRVISDAIQNFLPRGDAEFSLARNGLLTILLPAPDRSLNWYDRNGRILGAFAPPAQYTGLDFAPDGRDVALAVANPKTSLPNLWIYGVNRPTRTHLAATDMYEASPVWSADRRHVYFHSDARGVPDIYRRAIEGGPEELVFEAPGLQSPTDASPDGKWVVYTNSRIGTTGSDIMLLSLETRKSQPFVQSAVSEGGAQFSRDGTRIAYWSDESGAREIYVKPFPGAGEKTQITTSGGTSPTWSPDGRELFYIKGRDVMVVDMSRAPGALEPLRLFTLPDVFGSWEVAPDGRFLIATNPDSISRRENALIVNWMGLVEK